jgi:glycosyltransferase involved in cell wall biosynthesis
MKLAVVSHKVCWNSRQAPDFYQTDGGFPFQIKAISELFDETRVVVPSENLRNDKGVSPLVGKSLSVCPLSIPKGKDFRRKLDFPFWLLRNGWLIWREIKNADAVHAPIPGDIGTIGMLFALLLKKPLFVRYCGNWFVRRTLAEAFWKWSMERFAGGRNVMLATGGDSSAPSSRNANIKWIFSTSLTKQEIAGAVARRLSENSPLKLIIACRQEKGKGTDIVLESLAQIAERFPGATLDVIGDGDFLSELKKRAKILKLEDKTIFHGRVELKRVVELMKQAHVFCYPTESEGFPKVVLEALSCGLPVITTRVSVLPRLIGKDCGILLDKPTAEHLTAAIKMICSDAVTYRRMSESAIAAAQEYSLENWRDFIGETLRKSWQVASLSSV